MPLVFIFDGLYWSDAVVFVDITFEEEWNLIHVAVVIATGIIR